MSRCKNGSRPQSSKISELPSIPPLRSSVSARISSFSHGVSATRMPRSSIKRPSFVRNLTTSTSPTRL